MFSIITPTYNRANILNKSVESSILFLSETTSNDELIIIDDASTDETCEVISKKFHHSLKQGSIKYLSLEINKGVTFAKNMGASNSINEWLVFLDSDDQLLPGSRAIISNAIEDFPDTDVFFFRCIDDYSNLVGPKFYNSRVLSISDYIENGTYGECLPVIRKSIFLEYPYDEDLRGFEGLSYLKMALSGAILRIIKDPVRRYSLLGDDRLSTKLNIVMRADKLLLGYQRFFKLIKNEASIMFKIHTLLRILKYKSLLVVSFLVKRLM